MNLTLTLTDRRRKPGRQFGSLQPAEYETYDRANMSASGDAAVIAGILRSLADDIDPPFALATDEVSA